MKNVFDYLWKGVTGIFAIGLIAWAANLTIKAVHAAMPNDAIAPYLALVLFDGGALTWLNVFLSQAKGTPQRAAALVMTVLDLAGVIIMSAGGLELIGGRAISKALLIATLGNLGAWYFYKANSPDAIEAIQTQNLEDTLTTEALRQAQANTQAEAYKLGAIMARRVTNRIRFRLALPMEEEPIDGEAQDITPALPGPQAAPRFNVLDWVMGFFARGRKAQQPQPAPSEPTTTSQDTDSNSDEAPTDEGPQPSPDA